MSTRELKREINKAIDEVPETVLNDILDFVKNIKLNFLSRKSPSKLDYDKYNFEDKDLKFNRDEIIGL